VSVDAVRDQLAAILHAQHVPAERDANGDVYVHAGSATAYLNVVVPDDGPMLIDVWAPIAFDVPITAELHRYAAEFEGMFGRMTVEPTGDGVGQLVLMQSLLADPISPDVVMPILSIVATTADDLDDEVVARFGGRRAGGPAQR
jgi:hypothetical protein